MSIQLSALSFFEKFTAHRYQKIKNFLPTPESIWRADKTELLRAGWPEETINEFINWRRENPPEKCAEILKNKNIKTVCLDDPDYPELLRQISDPPVTLFYRGILKNIERGIGIVGTRKMSAYGKQATWQITGPLARQGVTIVSGLALGVDGEAHQATLAEKGHTVAVLGGSVEKRYIYPTFHNNLAEKIIESGGMVLSEYPPGFIPTLYSFPMRNRIIAGLSHGILVIEAPQKSGALITARVALDYNRDVFCIPHLIINKNGLGGNLLIGSGACITNSADDIFKNMSWEENENIAKPDMTIDLKPDELKIWQILQNEPYSINELIKKTGLTSREVAGIASILELKGQIKNIGNMTYAAI